MEKNCGLEGHKSECEYELFIAGPQATAIFAYTWLDPLATVYIDEGSRSFHRRNLVRDW